MAKRLADLIEVFQSWWPLEGAEEWDRVGLAIGSENFEITKALLSVDVTLSVLQEAKKVGAQLVISHHPPFLRPVHSLAEENLKGELATFAISNSIAVYSAHTNADIVQAGVSDVLASELGLLEAIPLVPTGNESGHGRIGKLKSPITLELFAEQISTKLPTTKAPIRVAGALDEHVSLVAVVGGAGDSFIEAAIASGADCLVTSDLRHHVTLDASIGPEGKRIKLIDISHFAAESLWLRPTAKKLGDKFPEIVFEVSNVVTDPWSKSILSGA